MPAKKIILLGGSGFIGSHLVSALSRQGYQITVPCRRPYRLNHFKLLPGLTLVEANILDPQQLQNLFKGQDFAINLLGILNETGNNSFQQIHVDFVKNLLQACDQNSLSHLLHLSALGADQESGSSLYLRSKGEGENLLHSFSRGKLQVTSFQPSVVFGEGDQFINRFASILKFCRGFFPLACSNSRMAPVYVNDLVDKMISAINQADSFGKRYTVCGPEVFTLRQIVEKIIQQLNVSCSVLPLNNKLSKLQARILQVLPGKLMTLDNYDSLQTDSVCTQDSSCPTSLSHYLKGISCLFNSKKEYDEYRRFH